MAKRLTLGLIVGIGCAALAYAALSPGRLIVSGREVPTDFITQNGRTYVPLSDVAKGLNMDVQKISGGFELKPAGGANQVEGLNGKIGDQLSCGAFLLKIVEVTETQEYTLAHNGQKQAPASTANKLVVVKFRLKNATPVTQSIDPYGGNHTALTDDEGHNFKSTNLDGERAPDVLPGAAVDFTLIFDIAKDAALGDMVYQLHSYTVKSGYKDYTFRISLKKSSTLD